MPLEHPGFLFFKCQLLVGDILVGLYRLLPSKYFESGTWKVLSAPE